MLKLHYTGPKPTINQHGISFKNAKIDKYLYLPIAIRILRTIDKKYTTQKSHNIYIDNHDNYSDEEMLQTIKEYEPELEKHVEAEERAYEQHIYNLIEEIKNKSSLNKEEKNIWLKNIEIMKPYLLQREINKLYYIHAIKHIKKLIYKYEISEIDIDFTLKDWHVLESISGNLEQGVKSVSTTIKVDTDINGISVVKLLVNHL
ncbi:hypothetical protein MNB_SV-12-1788 [hydrothermal vent metagenome]|uniref:Uncharacterized protein n=1 Tax=hydrothermal vent metagenome TaxID=652676 RepID=A0A1W1BJI8_9ZZZZ